jgi:hypothetical protein
MSSPVLAMTAIASESQTRVAPSRSFGVPVPPARNVTIPGQSGGRICILASVSDDARPIAADGARLRAAAHRRPRVERPKGPLTAGDGAAGESACERATRLGRREVRSPYGAGLKGAAARTKHGVISTAANGVSEERNKPRESSWLGI